ncbi:Autophagy-related protein [Paramyrothecium foliicola]|nr:Autophagy-related protein [Paramyrothecium foliicola]
MTSPSALLNRFTNPRDRSSVAHSRQSLHHSSSEYAMDELEPRPTEGSSQRMPNNGLEKIAVAEYRSSSEWNHWGSPASSRSSSKGERRAMFSGPPPPIARSALLKSNKAYPPELSVQGRASTLSDRATDHHHLSGSRSYVLFDQATHVVPINADSVWRGLQRQERALEHEIQQFLDLQAAGLVAGSGDTVETKGKDAEGYSDSGSSTPTGTFYSTATSKSRMVNSLYAPARATSEGNVIPVRQPTKGRPAGLRTARLGLQGTMDALAELKREEDAYIDTSASQRKKALMHLSRLSVRKDGISSELHHLEENEGEPLGQELRDLGTKYDSITQEIRKLEEKLVGMRNKRRWLREKMDDVKNKREAGLSGYRGALKDVNLELTSILTRPPIRPLDQEMFSMVEDADGAHITSSGIEFLQLLPERRTIDMARGWWEGELSLLERRKKQISKERQALEEGSAVWQEVIGLVTDFESSLRLLMKLGSSTDSEAPSRDRQIGEHTIGMSTVVQGLERYMAMAEAKHWNLLICAIGAELEAFRQAQNILHNIFPSKEAASSPEPSDGSIGPSPGEQKPADQADAAPEQHDESDNEVPVDLLVSRYEESDHVTQTRPRSRSLVHSDESENEIPPEFLDGKDRLDKT